MDSMVECFAVRRLSPFQGVAEVVKTKGARAVSYDGRLWHLLVLATFPPSPWGSLEEEQPKQRFVSFGQWSEKEGLVRIPIDPRLSLEALFETVQPLIEALPQVPPPFPLKDRLEYWLMDKEGRPLALLASAWRSSDLPRPEPVWKPAPAGTQRFEALAHAIQNRAGTCPQGRWFSRDEEGKGHAMEGEARRLPSRAFPEVLVREDSILAHEYVTWMAPYLLTLPLSPSTRERLESMAVHQPMAVQALHRLYPQVIDPVRMKTVLVEAALRKTAGQSTKGPR